MKWHNVIKLSMKSKTKRRIINIISIVLLLVMAFSGYQIYSIKHQQKRADEVYKSVSVYVRIPETQASSSGFFQNDLLYPEIDFFELKKINPDIVGWLYVEGTDINYPVVQGEDNDYYLDKLFNGEKNSSGSIFLDCNGVYDFSHRNNIIYGHNMKNGSMFGTLTRYKEQSFYDSYPTGMLVTPEGNYTVEFFAGYVCGEEGEAWKQNFQNDEDFDAWLRQLEGKSAFKGKVSPSCGDKILTLSTCSYEFEGARFVVAGVLK